RSSQESEPEVRPDPAKRFSAKLYVLIDRGCGSACEITLQLLEALPGRVLVGENSRGAVEYGDRGRLLLPHSRVHVALATAAVRYRDGRAVEGRGYAPDLRVAKGGDALAAALAEIR
ncbi:MAG: hypothetical protein HC902_04070, partial [Calothrix sp. SM1_5_4]|nr:hypothetical protein [Calothrix sp. SM1_5_4]